MLAIDRPTIAAPAQRLLKPHHYLERLRAVRLGAIAYELDGACRTARVVGHIARLFPGQEAGIDPRAGWSNVLNHLLRLVEKADWFEIDWNMLDYLYEWGMNDGDDDMDDDDNPVYEPMGWYYLSCYTSGIPVRFYNYSEEDWYESYYLASDYPALVAIRVGIDAKYNMDIPEELEPLTWINYDAALRQVDWAAQPAPLRAFPLAVRYVRRDFGNPLLDEGAEVMDLWPERWTWEDNLDEVWAYALYARPIWAAIEAVAEWLREDEDSVTQLMDVLVESYRDKDDDNESDD